MDRVARPGFADMARFIASAAGGGLGGVLAIRRCVTAAARKLL